MILGFPRQGGLSAQTDDIPLIDVHRRGRYFNVIDQLFDQAEKCLIEPFSCLHRADGIGVCLLTRW